MCVCWDGYPAVGNVVCPVLRPGRGRGFFFLKIEGSRKSTDGRVPKCNRSTDWRPIRFGGRARVSFHSGRTAESERKPNDIRNDPWNVSEPSPRFRRRRVCAAETDGLECRRRRRRRIADAVLYSKPISARVRRLRPTQRVRTYVRKRT